MAEQQNIGGSGNGNGAAPGHNKRSWHDVDLRNLPDEELVGLAVAGKCARAADVLLGRQRPWIFDRVRARSRRKLSPEDIEDAVQRMLTALWQGLPNYHGYRLREGPKPFRRFAERVVARRFKNHLRDLERRKKRSGEPDYLLSLDARPAGRPAQEMDWALAREDNPQSLVLEREFESDLRRSVDSLGRLMVPGAARAGRGAVLLSAGAAAKAPQPEHAPSGSKSRNRLKPVL